jgi:hypothetical protein
LTALAAIFDIIFIATPLQLSCAIDPPPLISIASIFEPLSMPLRQLTERAEFSPPPLPII